MKILPVTGLLIVGLLAIAAPDALAKKKKKHGNKPDTTAPLTAWKPDYSEPDEALAPYITHLDQLLALHRNAPKDVAPFLEQSSGQLAIAKMEFAAQRKTADAGDQPAFDAGIATCDALTRALDERQTVLGNLKASQSVKGSGRLENGPRKDKLSQGIRGGDLGKAVGTIAEYKREKDATKAAKKSAAQTDNSLNAMSINRWNQRSIELRKFIMDTYARTK